MRLIELKADFSGGMAELAATIASDGEGCTAWMEHR